jgi:hypothetical protein
MTLTEFKNNNKQWFSKVNQRFFNDLQYYLLKNKQTNTYFLVRLTYKFSDMFDGPRIGAYIINKITKDNTIGEMIEKDRDGSKDFETYKQAKKFIKQFHYKND